MRRFFKFIILRIQSSSWLHSKKIRPQLLRLTGMKIGKSHIGEQVIFDSLYPENIEIGDYSAITMRCVILTHFVEVAEKTEQNKGGRIFISGKVIIGDNVFIGAHTLICKPVVIGNDCIIAAGSVIVKDIPAGEIWGGVPAKFLKRRPEYEKENR
jgi:UDP-2-acetamido-3-amino-2,3-dideoxy-glucuronate N-acetyltransferase